MFAMRSATITLIKPVLQSHQILIVEDDADTRASLFHLLTHEGYSVLNGPLRERRRASGPQAGADGAGRGNPRVIERHLFSLARYLVERLWMRALAARRDHDAEDTLLNQFGTGRAEPRGEQAVYRRRCAAPLHVAEDGDTTLQTGQFLQPVGQAQRVPRVLLIKLD